MFLVGVMSSMCTLIVNLMIFMLGQNDDVDPTVVIIISSVVVAVIALPLFGFLVFHIYLSVSGKTTREIIKKIDSDKNKR